MTDRAPKTEGGGDGGEGIEGKGGGVVISGESWG